MLCPEHALRQICGLKGSDKTSLITATLKSHDIRESYTCDRVPAGMPFYSVQADLSEVQLVYFQRFIDEFLDYIYGM